MQRSIFSEAETQFLNQCLITNQMHFIKKNQYVSLKSFKKPLRMFRLLESQHLEAETYVGAF
jgi:hypothetical protein